MHEHICQQFQDTVAQVTLRHKSILDILSKTQEASARVNRAVTKAVTACGCVQVKAEKRTWPQDISLEDLHSFFDSHLHGDLCPECQEVVLREMGKLLFYVTALCNTLGLSLSDVLAKEQSKIATLGKFNLT